MYVVIKDIFGIFASKHVLRDMEACQLIHCLLGKHEEPSSMLRTHEKKLNVVKHVYSSNVGKD